MTGWYAAFLAGWLIAAPPPAEVPAIAFSERAAEANLGFVLRNHATPEKHQVETMPAGVAVLDYDRDGFEDLFFVNGARVPSLEKSGPADWNRLFRNRGDGTFEDVTGKAGVRGEGYSMAAAAGDFDGDGRTDLFVAGVHRNLLYRNNGDGTFAEVTEKAGLRSGGAAPWSISAGWFDFDNDGRLDLFVVNYCKWDPSTEPYCGLKKEGYRTYCHPKFYEGLTNQLYRNKGDGTFEDVSAASGIAAHIGKGMGVAFADYDDDGLMDVFVANDGAPNFLFHNEGGGKFSEAGLRSGVAYNESGAAVSSMGADFRDVDNDGRPDLLVTALSNEMFALFRNLGKRIFSDASAASRVGLLSLPWGGWSAGLFDLNNDGWKDIFAAAGHVMDNEELYSSRTYQQPNQVYRNLGGGRFDNAGAGQSGGALKPKAHRGCAFGDFDNDGRIDVVTTSLNEPAELLMNRSERHNHWLQLQLQGTRSNREGIGARVTLTDAGGRRQYNHVTTSVGYASSSSPRVHFGLGAEARPVRIEIRWPSGEQQILEGVETDRLLAVSEPAPAVK